MLNDLPLAAKRFVYGTTAAGVACIIWALTAYEGIPRVAVWLGLCALIAELYPVRLSEDGTVSVAAAIYLAAVILFPPPIAVLMTAVAGGLSDVLDRIPPIRVVFNTAQLAIAATASAVVYHLGPDGPFQFSTHALWGLAAGLTFLFTNSLLTCTVIGLVQGSSPLVVWLDGSRAMILHDVALYPIGMLFAIVYQHDPLALFLFALPMIIIYVSFRSNVLLRQQTRQVLETLADILDKRDSYTDEHSRRVADFSFAIAREMGLSYEEASLIHSAARIHDLGKVTWGDNILLKPGKLTPQEMEKVRKHPVIGAEIVQHLWNYKEGVPLIRHHHERVDGTGYPQGLKGDNIPLGARIMAVADAYDAMTSDRPYRKALSQEEALRRLMAGAGTQFDPDVVTAFMRWIETHHSGGMAYNRKDVEGAEAEAAATIDE